MWVSMANGILVSIIKAKVSNLAGFVLISCTSAIYHEEQIPWVVAGWRMMMTNEKCIN